MRSVTNVSTDLSGSRSVAAVTANRSSRAMLLAGTCASILSALCAWGPAQATEHSYDFVACTTGRGIPLEANAEIYAASADTTGVVASSTTPDWEKASTRCVGYIRVIAGKPVGKGLCKWMRANGDTGVGEWEMSAEGQNRWTWLAGTGGLKGIRGGGTFQTVFSARPVEPGTSQGCRRDWGTYTLP